ncbi:MAG TPA: DUF3048 domain-containing protein [Jatrophihabitans sp.]|nr:DUF3048 domain-containing protein [Jatrophihabitans sp.]
MIGPLSRNQALIGGGVVAVVVIGGIAAVTLSGKHSQKAAAPPAPPTSAATSASATPTPTPTPAKPAPRLNPLTGIGAPPSGPIIGVKIDDTENGRPSRGIDQADVIYIEEAEGGLTRMLAVFGTHKPIVEAVRSVRASDPELLGQYGPITLVASGGGGDSLPTLDASIIKGVINDRNGPGFSRDDSRPAPYNLESNLATVSSVIKTAGSRSIGFNFAASYPALASAPSIPLVHAVVGSTGVDFKWEPTIGKYVRLIDGQHLLAADGQLVAASNVLIQVCQVTTNPNDVDVEGNPSRYTHTVGSGQVVLYRNGKRIIGRWSRPNSGSATTYTDLSGKPLEMAPGNTIVALTSA